MATHSSVLAWRILWTEEPGECSPWGHKELEPVFRQHFLFISGSSSGSRLELLEIMLVFVQVSHRPELEASTEKKPQRSWLEFGHRENILKTNTKILGMVAKTLCI